MTIEKIVMIDTERYDHYVNVLSFFKDRENCFIGRWDTPECNCFPYKKPTIDAEIEFYTKWGTGKGYNKPRVAVFFDNKSWALFMLLYNHHVRHAAVFDKYFYACIRDLCNK